MWLAARVLEGPGFGLPLLTFHCQLKSNKFICRSQFAGRFWFRIRIWFCCSSGSWNRNCNRQSRVHWVRLFWASLPTADNLYLAITSWWPLTRLQNLLKRCRGSRGFTLPSPDWLQLALLSSPSRDRLEISMVPGVSCARQAHREREFPWADWAS